MNNNSTHLGAFGLLRSWFFPIFFKEMSQFFLMALMMLFVVFNYTILRNFKDALIVNAPGSDATVISFLKMWGTTPVALAYMVFYAKGIERYGREKIVYYSLMPLLLFFAFFATILFPYHNSLHPSLETIEHLQQQWPHFKWWLAIWGNWSYALFFVIAELCGSISLSLFFWQFANAVCDKQQAKRFYPLFGLLGNLGLILAGYLMRQLAHPELYFKTSNPWQTTLQILLSCVCASLAIIQIIYYFLNRHVEKDPIVYQRLKEAKSLPKSRPTLKQALAHVFASKHLACIAMLVFAYGLTINYCDVLWKSELKTYFRADPGGYSQFMGGFSITIGLLTIPLMLLSSHLLRHLSWISAAILAPLIMLIAGGGFFLGVLWGLWRHPEGAILTIGGVALTPLALAVHFGYWQNALSKASKYSLFDPTKEMAYIPLDDEVKTKGKAAVDVVGARFGKTGGSMTFFLLQTLFPQFSLQQITPFIFCIFLIVVWLWFRALKKLQPALQEEIPYSKI